MKRYSIGHFSKVTGLTPRTLRFYDEQGLLSPADTDTETGYRFYEVSQTADAERIRLLRSLDMSLDDIKRFLAIDDPAEFQAKLLEHRREIESRIARYQRALQALDLIETRTVLPHRVRIKTSKSQDYIFVQKEANLAQIESVRERAFGELYAYLKQHKLEPAGAGFSYSIGLDTNEYDIHEPQKEWHSEKKQITVAVPTSEKLEPFNTIEVDSWKGGQVAYILHPGPYEPLHIVYCTLTTWLTDNDIEPLSQIRELYLVGPADTNDKNSFRTELQVLLPEGGHDELA